jgi:hypothetical protein
LIQYQHLGCLFKPLLAFQHNVQHNLLKVLQPLTLIMIITTTITTTHIIMVAIPMVSTIIITV